MATIEEMKHERAAVVAVIREFSDTPTRDLPTAVGVLCEAARNYRRSTERLRAENEQLEAVVKAARALIKPDVIFNTGDFHNRCIYCEELFQQHTADCPVKALTDALAALGGE